MTETAGISYQIHQTGGQPANPPLVLLHGAGGNRMYWPPEISRLQGGTVYAIDLPGHGKSTNRSQATIAGYAKEITNWLQELQLELVILVGHSMGGAIAMQLALDAPGHVAGLVLIGSSARLCVNPFLLASTQDPVNFSDAVATIIDWSFSQAADRRLKELAARRMLEIQPDVLHNDFLACQNFDLSDRLGEIHCPTLILCGTEDKMTPPHLAQSLVEKIQNARLELVHAAGHMLMLEQPGPTAAILQGFITAL